MLVAVLLFVTASLKLVGLNMKPLPPVSWMGVPAVQVATLEWEFLLGLWLVSCRHSTAAWAFALATFLAFFSVAAYLALVGQVSCGCFGAMVVSPWRSLLLDGVVIVLLLLVRPNLRQAFRLPLRDAWAPLRGGVATIAGAASLLGAFALASHLMFGSMAAGLYWLRGDRITVSIAQVDFGSAAPAEERETSIEVKNWLNRPVRLVGGNWDQSFQVDSPMPMLIPAGEARTVRLKWRSPLSGEGFLVRNAQIWTDCDEKRIIRLMGVCRIRGAGS